MSQQNLISAAIASDVKARVIANLSAVKKDLDFLVTLQSKDVQGIFKAGNTFVPFIDLAYEAAIGHPEIIPAVIDMEEFKKDYALAKDIAPITSLSNEISEGLEKTNIAVNSDSMAVSLEIYSAVKQHKDKVPGLKTIADKMGEFFKRSKRTDKNPK